MTQAKESVQLTILDSDCGQPSTSKEESPRSKKKGVSITETACKGSEQLTVLDIDGENPSTSRKDSNRSKKERRSLGSFLAPSWRIGHTRSSRVRAASLRNSQSSEEKVLELPSVLRESVVESKIIPPLPRLSSMEEEMPAKLSRVLGKLEKLMMTKEDANASDSEQDTYTSAPGPSKIKAE